MTTSSTLVVDELPAGPLHLTVRSGTLAAMADVTTAAGRETQLSLALQAGATVRGRLVDGEGAPVRGWVSVRDAADRETSDANAAWVDDTGRFSIGPLAPGSYRLWANTAGVPTELPLTVTAGQQADVGDVKLGGVKR